MGKKRGVVVESFEPVWFPIAAAEDTRTKPRHLSLLLAAKVALYPHEGELDCFYDYGSPERAVPIDQRRLMELAHFGDVATLRRARADLAAWEYSSFLSRRGRAVAYDVRTPNDPGWEWDSHVAVPVGLVRDGRLKPGHVAAYLALCVEAERERRVWWQRDELGNLAEDAPTYGTGCTVMGSRIDELAGFTHSLQRNRYLEDLATFGHVRFGGKRGRADRYELLTDKAAQRALTRFLRQADDQQPCLLTGAVEDQER